MPSKRKLLVEGAGDCRIIVEFVKKNGVTWDAYDGPVVQIESIGGVESLLKPGVIQTYLKESDLKALGILVDADDDCAARWQSIRSRCKTTFPDLEDKIQPNGVIAENDNGVRLGVWIMPDNQASGMIETFMQRLIPEEGRGLLDFAKECVEGSRTYDASWRDSEKDKAIVHTWLAWQKRPGSQLHSAITKQQLRADSESAAAFMAWFRQLYQLEETI